jgi:hypothetical protein
MSAVVTLLRRGDLVWRHTGNPADRERRGEVVEVLGQNATVQWSDGETETVNRDQLAVALRREWAEWTSPQLVVHLVERRTGRCSTCGRRHKVEGTRVSWFADDDFWGTITSVADDGVLITVEWDDGPAETVEASRVRARG